MQSTLFYYGSRATPDGASEKDMDVKSMVVWIVALVLLAALVASPVACTMNRQRLIADAIKNGADPIAVKCAIESTEDSSRSSVLCMAKALKN